MTEIKGKVKINDLVVKPVKQVELEMKDIRGSELFPEIYSNIMLCAKKKSGKTSTLFYTLKKCAGPNTVIVIYASTVHKDENYKAIRKYFKKKDIAVEVHTHFLDSGKNGKNDLEDLIKEMQEEDEIDLSSEEEKPKEKPKIKLAFEEDEEEKEKKEKKKSPDFIFVFDDLSTELRNKTISAFLKSNRHYKSKIIISSQVWTDLEVQARQQLDYVLLFKGHPTVKLDMIHKNLDLSIPFEKFVELYNDATAEPYHFLYIDVRKQQYRQDFNKAYVIKE